MFLIEYLQLFRPLHFDAVRSQFGRRITRSTEIGKGYVLFKPRSYLARVGHRPSARLSTYPLHNLPPYHDHVLRTAMSKTKAQLQRAIIQITEKQPIPEIDFTQHTLDDGSSVSTQERVIKDVRCFLLLLALDGKSLMYHVIYRYNHPRCLCQRTRNFSLARTQQNRTSRS